MDTDDIDTLIKGIKNINIFETEEEYDLLMEGFTASEPSSTLLSKASRRYNRYISLVDLSEYPELKNNILSFLRYDCLDSKNFNSCFILMKQIDSYIYNVIQTYIK